MSTVRFEISGVLTAFHVSHAAGVVVCLQADLGGLDLDEIGRIGPNMRATIEVEAVVPGDNDQEAAP